MCTKAPPQAVSMELITVLARGQTVFDRIDRIGIMAFDAMGRWAGGWGGGGQSEVRSFQGASSRVRGDSSHHRIGWYRGVSESKNRISLLSNGLRVAMTKFADVTVHALSVLVSTNTPPRPLEDWKNRRVAGLTPVLPRPVTLWGSATALSLRG